MHVFYRINDYEDIDHEYIYLYDILFRRWLYSMYIFHPYSNIFNDICCLTCIVIRRFVLNEHEGNGIDSQKQNDVCNEPRNKNTHKCYRFLFR